MSPEVLQRIQSKNSQKKYAKERPNFEQKPKRNNFIDYNMELDEELPQKKEERMPKTEEKKKPESINIIQLEPEKLPTIGTAEPKTAVQQLINLSNSAPQQFSSPQPQPSTQPHISPLPPTAQLPANPKGIPTTQQPPQANFPVFKKEQRDTLSEDQDIEDSLEKLVSEELRQKTTF